MSVIACSDVRPMYWLYSNSSTGSDLSRSGIVAGTCLIL